MVEKVQFVHMHGGTLKRHLSLSNVLSTLYTCHLVIQKLFMVLEQ